MIRQKRKELWGTLCPISASSLVELLAEGKKVSKRPPIVRIKTLRRPVPERKSNELLAVGFATDAEAYIGAAQQRENFQEFWPAIFAALLRSRITSESSDSRHRR